jgi:hypothetical protein
LGYEPGSSGPLYFGGVYLGDDPDPNIRFQIMRDISGRFGGEQQLAALFRQGAVPFDFCWLIG